MSDVIVIGVAGGTGSGKTTLVKALVNRFGDNITVLSHDNYYKRHDELTYEERTKLNYDHPDAFDTDMMIEHLQQLREGHAIECRINAEDPVQGFRPCPGRVDFLHFPGGPGVRVDSCLYSGCELSPYYDSMAAKILAYAPTRMETIRRMRRCLEEFTLEGFPTNAELSYQILYHPEFILGECTTAFLDEHLSELLEFSRKLSESGVDA